MSADETVTVAELGEFSLIDEVVGAELSDRVPIGPGDDSALVLVDGAPVLVATDMLVEDRHFRRDWADAYDVGRRAAAANLADIAAMGGVTTALTVAFAAPGDLPVRWAVDLARGISDEAGLVGAEVVGGDVTASDKIVVSVTVLGRCDAEPVRRSGAQPGDVVALTGRIGWAAAGLAVLGRGFRSPRAVVDAYRRPEPPYDQGPVAARAGAHAMIDVSDGLLADLGHVADASGVAIDVDPGAFEVAQPLQDVGAATNVDPLAFVLTGGDDHPLVATFASGSDVPDGWQVVGRVLDGSGVTVAGSPWDGPAGHEHYR